MASYQPPMVIPFSKGKILMLALLAAVFVVLGAWLFLNANELPRQNPLLVKVIGGVCVLFFGACGVVAVRKLFDSAPGLVIDAEGIVDNSSGISAGRIPWSEIIGFKVSEIQRQKFLSIDVRDPEKYLQRASIPKRWLVAANMKFYGGPIHISANALAISFDDLMSAIAEARARHIGPER